ncbi:MAG TPA: MogA/MoaB family molybdenum cofactor biosynthesis protein [Candidatus Latescibacteria bacterium]|nr:MogA/MoaB family molybdenum cofactor biosynthesis protein [Candidatus Latescibacterota bacterium]
MKVAILTISDRAFEGTREDASGPALAEAVRDRGWEVALMEVLPDERGRIAERLGGLAGKVDLILTTGGTGLSPKDVTPEATLDVVERRVPGIPEAMRAEGLEKTPMAMLSRAEAGVLRGTLIVNLPGSPKGALECLEAVADALPHAVEVAQGRGEHGGKG